MPQTLDHALDLHRQGRLAEAEAIYRSIIAAEPANADARHLLGMVAFAKKDFEAAWHCISQAIALNDRDERYHLNGANALRSLNRNDEALAHYDQAVKIKPDYAEAWFNRALLLLQTQRFDDAQKSFEKAALQRPGSPELPYNWGVALSGLKRHAEALASFEKAISLRPDFIQAHYNRGVTLAELRRFEEALASYDTVLGFRPEDAQTHNNRANMLAELGRNAAALEAYNRAIALKPDYAEAHNNRANGLADLKRYDEALAGYRTAQALKSDFDLLPGAILNAQMHLCDWDDLEQSIKTLRDGLNAGRNVIAPFALLALSSSMIEQRRCAEIHVRDRIVAPPADTPFVKSEGKIRLGYFSPDFRAHPVSYLTAGLFEQHDRTRFEVVAFSYGPSADDPVRQRLEKAFDSFIDVRNKTDGEIIAMSRAMGIDIAIDLAGYTQASRSGIFAGRAAPVQVNYLGYPGTMAADFIDYMIGDDIVIPAAQRDSYSEKIVVMPDCFQVNDARPAAQAPSRSEMGLKDDAVVFCSFNNVYKLNPDMISVWLHILQQTPNSVLWLLGENETQIKNLRAFTSRHGVDAQRLVFAGRLPYADHMARYHLADLVLDTLPFNGGTTTSDALWGGAPVLTCLGETYAGRMAGSLLNAVGLPELIAANLTDYETLAVELGRSPARLQALKNKLNANRATAPLFDVARFARRIESAYAEMVRRSRVGLAPDHIAVGKMG